MSRDLILTKMIVERDGEEQEIEIEGYVEFSVDTRYGEDAEGGRGECRTFVEDVTDICAYTVEGDDFKLTDQEKDCAAELIGEKFLMG